jgi:hypothetical protein
VTTSVTTLVVVRAFMPQAAESLAWASGFRVSAPSAETTPMRLDRVKSREAA